tara:strand:- start:7748 stop:8098 length:351 start_codon:yes stop_codon:yes gene_type:complete
MLEEIQALMPILERISDGALWAFLIFMFVKMLGILIWPIILLFVVTIAGKYVVQIARDPRVGEIDVYNIKYNGNYVKTYYAGDIKTLSDFLSWASSSGGYVISSDLKRIMKEGVAK